MSKKITSYQGMIGKTIKRIDDDGTAVKFTFEDDSFAYMEGDFEMQLSVDSFKGERDPMIKPTVYERPKIIKFESILDDLNILRSKTTGGSFGGFFGIK